MNKQLTYAQSKANQIGTGGGTGGARSAAAPQLLVCWAVHPRKFVNVTVTD